MMPKRVIDWDAIAASDKLAELAADGRATEVAYYPWVAGLALANGTFECSAEKIQHTYARVVRHLSVDDWRGVIAELERRHMLFTWRDPATQKRWAFVVRIEERLPSPTDLVRYRYPLGLRVPIEGEEGLAAFLGISVEQATEMLAGTAAAVNPREVEAARTERSRNGGRVRKGKGARAAAAASADMCQPEVGIGIGEVKVGGKELPAEGTSSARGLPFAPLRAAPRAEEGAGRLAPKDGAKGSSRRERGSDCGDPSRSAGSGPLRMNGQPQPVTEATATATPEVLRCAQDDNQGRERGSYRRFQEKYREICGRVPADGRGKVARYYRLCAMFGEAVVLDALAEWARGRGGAGMLRGNRHAEWDFLDSQARIEIEGAMGAAAREAGRGAAAAQADCAACGGSGWVFSGAGRQRRTSRCACVQ